ncbi:MAG: response regulator [Candidatus Margulisiibacteriota bacterium]
MEDLKNKKILIVDDEPDVLELLKKLFSSEGFSVITASDGQSALELARKEKPSLIILDIMLPKMDGYVVARMLKFDENFSRIPIIILSAKIQEKDKQLGFEMGVDEYLTKPFDPEALLKKAREIIEKSSRGR